MSSCHTGEEPEDFYDSNGNMLNSTAVCLFWLNEADVVEAARISSIQALLNNRLALAATVGDAALATAISALQAASPEVAVVILADTGADPINDPYLVQHFPLLSYWPIQELTPSSVPTWYTMFLSGTT